MKKLIFALLAMVFALGTIVACTNDTLEEDKIYIDSGDKDEEPDRSS